MAGLRDWLHRRRHPQRFALLAGLLDNHRLTADGLRERQRRQLADIVAHAAANTDYYRERYAGIRGIADGGFALADLPLLTKNEVTGNLDRLLDRHCDRALVRLGHTGGSTGQPTPFWYDAAKHELMRAGMCRSYMGSGWRPGQKILNFWGARQDIRGGGLAKRWGEIVTGEKTLAAHRYDERQLEAWARYVAAHRPVLLQGYASILAELARYVADRGLAMPDSLLGVYSTAEVLTAGQREAMERGFGCKVFNQYGSREVPNIACECRRGNMHVFTDMVWLESLADDRLVVTSLTNRLMPFIRYDIGDSGRLREGGCDCGWPFPLMEMGMCRQNDIIRTADGRSVHPAYFNGLLYGIAGIRQYRWVQESPSRMRLEVAAEPALADGVAQALAARLRAELGMEFTLSPVEAIARTASGKHRFVIGYRLPASNFISASAMPCTSCGAGSGRRK